MTVDKGFKRIVRTRARRTGESYVAARRALLEREGGSRVDTRPLYGLSDLLLSDEQIPAGFELNRDWSGPINRHYEGPTFEAPGFIRDDPDNPNPPTTWSSPPRSVKAQRIKPFLVELGLQGGYNRRWDEANFDPSTKWAQTISNEILELRDSAAGLTYIAHNRRSDARLFAPTDVDPATYRVSVHDIGATWVGAEFCVDRFVCSVTIVLRSRTETESLAQQLIEPYVRFVHDADPGTRLQ